MSEPAYPLAYPETEDGREWPRQGSWTYEVYRRLPNDGRRYEVVRGFLYVTPAPSFDHQFAVWQLSRQLGNFVVENDLGIILLAPFDIRLPGGIASPVQPDVAFVRSGNQPRPGDGSFEGVPDLVVEVLSRSTRARDRGIKMKRYAASGIPHYWIVDPRTRTLEAYRLTEDGYELTGTYGPGSTFRPELFPGLEIPIDELWA